MKQAHPDLSAINLGLGGYPDLNRELTVPHTVALPIKLHPPCFYDPLPCPCEVMIVEGLLTIPLL